MSTQNAFMQPFDEISTVELGLEDDVLISPPHHHNYHNQHNHHHPSSTTHTTITMQNPPEPRYPIPKWMRPAQTSPIHAPSLLLARLRDSLIPQTRRTLSRLLSPLFTLLRPRLTPRYAIFALLTLWLTYRLLTSQPLLASSLPPSYTGPYGVGALDVEVPLDTPRLINDVRFKQHTGGGDHAFRVDTVLFTLYYPTAQHHAAAGAGAATAPATPHHYPWIPKPISATARGYARALGLDNILVRTVMTSGLWLVASGIRIPARVGAPLLPAGEMGGYGDQVGDGRLPVMVFSHGMLSSRTDYTAYLSELASRGVVVAALEHRDGSSPASPVVRGAGAPAEWRYYFGLDDLDASPSGEGEGEGGVEMDGPGLKEAQLSFREAEIEAAVDVLRRLNAGDASLVNTRLLPPPPAVKSIKSMTAGTAGSRNNNNPAAAFKARLNTQAMTLAGHSYGGTGVLRALRGGPSEARPFSGAVVLDPGKSSGQLNADVGVPLVVCHSSSWSKAGPSLFFGRPHFEVVRDIVDGVNGICADQTGGVVVKGEEEEEKEKRCREKGWFMTSLGTSHPSITDAPVLEPLLLSWTTGSTMDAQQGIRQYVLLTRDFVRYQHTGDRDGLLALSDSKGDGVVSREYDPKHNDGMPEQWRKYWQLHVAPPA